jgi:hypothetical protein
MKKSKRSIANEKRSGLHGLMSKVGANSLKSLDRRSAGFRAMQKWRGELVSDLGGEENISSQERALVETVCRTQLFLADLDVYLLNLPTIVNRRKRSVFPAAMQRQQFADSIMKNLTLLGIKRRPAPVKSLQEVIQQIAAERDAKTASAAPSEPADERSREGEA